jgi:hypothetical protein
LSEFGFTPRPRRLFDRRPNRVRLPILRSPRDLLLLLPRQRHRLHGGADGQFTSIDRLNDLRRAFTHNLDSVPDGTLGGVQRGCSLQLGDWIKRQICRLIRPAIATMAKVRKSGCDHRADSRRDGGV